MEKQLRETFGKGLPDAVATSQAAMQRMDTQFKLLVRDLRPLIEGFKKFIAAVGEGFLLLFRSLVSWTKAWFNLYSELWNGGFKALADNAVAIMKNMWIDLKATFKTGLKDLFQFLSEIGTGEDRSALGRMFSLAFGPMFEAMAADIDNESAERAIVKSFTSIIESSFEKTIAHFGDSGDRFKEALNKLSGGLLFPDSGKSNRETFSADPPGVKRVNALREALEGLFKATEDGAVKAQDMIESWMDRSYLAL